MNVQVGLELCQVSDEAPGIRSFKFNLKERKFDFKAGQHISMKLQVSDPRGPRRSFSIASSPTETNYLMICTRISESPFKQKLSKLPLGTNVAIGGPSGSFVLEGSSKHVVFLAGGIGITPFRSMVQFATDTKLDLRISLIRSSRITEEVLFNEELEHWRHLNPNLAVLDTISRPEESKQRWTGRIGRIDRQLIDEAIGKLDNQRFYVCGPPTMVDSMVTMLSNMGVGPNLIKMEKFTGYD